MAGNNSVSDSNSSPVYKQVSPSAGSSPALSRKISVVTPDQLKQKALDKADRWVIGGYILAAIAVAGVAASIGLGIHTHKLFLGLLPGIGSGLVGLAAWGAISHGKDNLDKLTPAADKVRRSQAKGSGSLRRVPKHERGYYI